jgi:hypothetical protein
LTLRWHAIAASAPPHPVPLHEKSRRRRLRRTPFQRVSTCAFRTAKLAVNAGAYASVAKSRHGVATTCGHLQRYIHTLWKQAWAWNPGAHYDFWSCAPKRQYPAPQGNWQAPCPSPFSPTCTYCRLGRCRAWTKQQDSGTPPTSRQHALNLPACN